MSARSWGLADPGITACGRVRATVRHAARASAVAVRQPMMMMMMMMMMMILPVLRAFPRSGFGMSGLTGPGGIIVEADGGGGARCPTLKMVLGAGGMPGRMRWAGAAC